MHAASWACFVDQTRSDPVALIELGPGAVLPIKNAHTYLVHPGKGVEALPIKESELALEGKLFGLLNKIYENAEDECNLDILFEPIGGKKQNDCRDLFVAYAGGPTIVRGRKIAERLQLQTDKRSGIGLLFVVAGEDAGKRKLLVARFSTDTGVLADEDAKNFTVKFLERIFMRSSKSYKAVYYRDADLEAGFWTGRAIDRQINSGPNEVSQYWISDFLKSNLSVTPLRGTNRLAKAMKAALKSSNDASVKEEVIAAAKLAEGFAAKKVSVDEIVEQLHLSDEASTAIKSHLPPGISSEKFKFDLPEFRKHVGFRVVSLDIGVVLMADAVEFDDLIKQQKVPGADGAIRFSTQGHVVKDTLGKPVA